MNKNIKNITKEENQKFIDIQLKKLENVKNKKLYMELSNEKLKNYKSIEEYEEILIRSALENHHHKIEEVVISKIISNLYRICEILEKSQLKLIKCANIDIEFLKYNNIEIKL